MPAENPPDTVDGSAPLEGPADASREEALVVDCLCALSPERGGGGSNRRLCVMRDGFGGTDVVPTINPCVSSPLGGGTIEDARAGGAPLEIPGGGGDLDAGPQSCR